MDAPTSKTVLVVAPESDLRRSLAFMLAAEGFIVETGTAWPQEDTAGIQAVIIDDDAVGKAFRGDDRLTALGRNVLVLSGRSKPWCGLPAATVIHKPLLDHVVVNTLKGLST